MRITPLTSAALVAAGAYGYKRFARARRRIDLVGRVVVITGGSRGLGLALARRFAAEGARLALLARDSETLQRAAIDVAGSGADVLTIPCDLRDAFQVRQAIDLVLDRLGGRLDVLVNNAGTIQVGPIDHMSEHDFEESLDLHLRAPLRTTLAALPTMRLQRFGRIVNVASIGGKVGVPHLAPYCAGKFALVGLSESLRAELEEDGILVTTVCPGLMRTGSPPNAQFKGRHREEYAWFAFVDASPLTSIAADRAARKIVDAARHGDAQLTITPQAKLAVLLNAVAPELSARGRAIFNRLLPGVSLLNDTESFTGWQSRGQEPDASADRNLAAAQQHNQLAAPAAKAAIARGAMRE